MILTTLSITAMMSLAPVTPVASVHRRAWANAEAVRVALIDASLIARPVELVGVDLSGKAGDQIAFVEGRTRRTLAPDAAVALAPEWWIIDASGYDQSMSSAAVVLALAEPTASVVLVDGQRLTGSLAPPSPVAADQPGAATDDQSIRWTHPRLGTLTIPLDQIDQLVLAPTTDAPASTSAAPQGTDLVRLRNGDQLTGFVDSIGRQIIVSATGAPPVHIDVDQAAMIRFSNPARSAEGPRVWLADGSIVAAARLEVDASAGRVTVAARSPSPSVPGVAAASVDLSDLRGIALDASRMTALASLRVASFGPLADRRIAEPPRNRPIIVGSPSPLGADDIELPGPMFVEWVLPPSVLQSPGATGSRLAGWVTLDPGARTWGDCQVVISIIEPGADRRSADASSARILARERLNGERPAASVGVAIPGGLAAGSRLRIAVEAGENGAVQDRVSLRRMLLATGAAPDRSTVR